MSTIGGDQKYSKCKFYGNSKDMFSKNHLFQLNVNSIFWLLSKQGLYSCLKTGSLISITIAKHFKGPEKLSTSLEISFIIHFLICAP